MAITAISSKVCIGPCGEEKSLEEFHKHNTGIGGRHPWCKVCKNQQAKERYASNVNHYRHKQKAATIKWRYGLEPDDYLTMVEKATCNICGTSEPGRGQEFLCVDHDHETGDIRGTLCIPCNLAIGYLKDDPALAMKAASYLSTHQKEGGYHRNNG